MLGFHIYSEQNSNKMACDNLDIFQFFPTANKDRIYKFFPFFVVIVIYQQRLGIQINNFLETRTKNRIKNLTSQACKQVKHEKIIPNNVYIGFTFHWLGLKPWVKKFGRFFGINIISSHENTDKKDVLD